MEITCDTNSFLRRKMPENGKRKKEESSSFRKMFISILISFFKPFLKFDCYTHSYRCFINGAVKLFTAKHKMETH